MSTVEELEKQIQDLQKELELKKQKESFEFPVGYHDTYYCLTAFAEIKEDFWIGSIRDENKSYQGNVFKTKQEAEKERDRRALLTRFRQFRDKCNGEWKPDFNDDDSWKYCIGFNHTYNMMKVYSYFSIEEFNLFGYFRKESDAERAIELFGKEIKRLFVEEENE